MSAQNKDQLYGTLLLIMMILLLAQIVPMLAHYQIFPEKFSNAKFFDNIGNLRIVIVVCYLIVVPITARLVMHMKIAKSITKEQQTYFKLAYYALSVLVLIGPVYIHYFTYYNFVFLPVILMLHLRYGSLGFSKAKSTLSEENPFAKLSTKTLQANGVIFETTEGPLHLHNPAQGVGVQGGAGSGKSKSIFFPAIKQTGLQNTSAIIYDYKGSPPTLGRMAYNVWLLKNDSKLLKPTFHVLSFDNDFIGITARPNPFNPKFLDSTIDTQAVLYNFLYGLSPEWRVKKDFWAQSGTALALGIAERLRLDPDLHRYLTLPHIISLATANPIALLTWIRQDREVERIIQTLLSNLDGGVMQTLSNQTSTLQSLLPTMVSSREIYWTFGAPIEEQTPIDVNNPTSPMILSISNSPERDEALSPVISCLIGAIHRVANTQGKHPCSLFYDELPTIFIDKLSKIPATGRENQLSSWFGIQDESQLEELYKKQADVITSNLGSFFLGMTNNPKTAGKYSTYFGTKDIINTSHSVGTGSISSSDSIKEKKILQARDIANQPVGHFVGKIADGDPAMFSVQMKEFKTEEHFPDWKETIDIKPQGYLGKLQEKTPESYIKVCKQLSEINFLRIQNEVDGLLAPFMPEIED
jgi:hypothetical protein